MLSNCLILAADTYFISFNTLLLAFTSDFVCAAVLIFLQVSMRYLVLIALRIPHLSLSSSGTAVVMFNGWRS